MTMTTAKVGACMRSVLECLGRSVKDKALPAAIGAAVLSLPSLFSPAHASSLGEATPSEKIGTASLLTPSQVDSYYGANITSTNGLGWTSRPPEVVELARALAGNTAAPDPANPSDTAKTVDRIYQYVRNNVENVWLYGMQKGAAGAIIDHSGTAFDQANLMVELLRQAGYAANYQVGTITLSGQQFYHWTGIQNAQAACQLLSNGSIGAVINGTTDPTCASYAGTTVSSITLNHVWVQVAIGSSSYLFDPAFKPHTHKAGINLAATAQLTSGQALAQATSGQMAGADAGTGQAYVASLNSTALYSTIQTYGQNLLAYIRQHPEAQMEDIVGGDVIARYETPQGGLRQTTLRDDADGSSYTATVMHTWTGAVPDQYRTKLEVNDQYVPSSTSVTIWDKTFFADEIYGRKLTVYQSSSPDYTTYGALLVITDGAGNAVPGVPSTPPPSGQTAWTSTMPGAVAYWSGQVAPSVTVNLTVNHPYAASADGSATTHGDYMRASITKVVDPSLPFVIVNAWGDANGLVAKWGNRADANLGNVQIASGCETCNPPPPQQAGDGTREGFAAAWIQQSSMASRLHAAIAGSVYQLHHSVGIVSADVTWTEYTKNGVQYNYSGPNASMVITYMPPLFNKVADEFNRVDVDSAFSIASKTADPLARRAAIHAIAASTDALEGSVVGQMLDLPDTVSTAARFEWGNAPPLAEDIYAKGARRFFTFDSTNAGNVPSIAKVEGRNDYQTNDPCTLYFTTGQGAFSYSATTPQPPQMCYRESLFWAASLPAAVQAYTQAGFSVVTSEEAHLGPGQPFGAFWLGSVGSSTPDQYTIAPTLQRGGSFVATRYVGSDPVEIAHVAVVPAGGVGNYRVFKGGGGGVQTDNTATYDPSQAADILKPRFVDHSSALGVDQSTGEPTYTAPAGISVGSGEFPYKLTAQWLWKGGPITQTDAWDVPTSLSGPQPTWTTNWHNSLSLSGSGLEAMGASDTRAAAGSIAAFMAMQDIYKAAPSTSRDVAGVLANAWWVKQLAANTVTVTIGTSSRQFLRLVDGSFIVPGTGFALLTQTGARAISTDTTCMKPKPPYFVTRGWDYSGLSFAVTNKNGDVQNFGYWRNQVIRDSYCALSRGFRLNTWVFPKGVTVTVNYDPGYYSAGITTPDLNNEILSVSNSLGRQINFISGGVVNDLVAGVSNGPFGFNNNLSGADARSASMTQADNPATGVATYTFTDPASVQTNVDTQQNILPTYSWGTQAYSRLLTRVYAPNSPTTPVLQYDYDSLFRVKQAWDANALQLGNRQPYQFYIANHVRGERQDPNGGSFAVEYDIYKRPIEYFDEIGRETKLACDARGRVASYTYPEGDQQQFVYDSTTNNVLYVTSVPKIGSAELAQNQAIQVAATWDPTWNKLASITNAYPVTLANGVAPVGAPAGVPTTTFSYYPSGQAGAGEMQTATRPAPQAGAAQPVYNFSYMNFGELYQATDPTGVVTQHGYDGNGDLTSVTIDPGAAPHVNSSTGYGYDLNGEVISTTDPNLNVSNFVYDLDGRKTFEIAPAVTVNGQSVRLTTRHVYDLLGRETETDKGTATTPNASDFTTLEAALFTYDPAGNKLTAWTPTAIPPGQTVAQVTPAGLTQMNYAPLNRVACSAVRMNPAVYGSLPDACSLSAQPTSNSFGPDRITQTVYDAAGQQLKIIRGFGTSIHEDYATYTYSPDGKQNTVADANGNLTSYLYDGFDRLITTRFPAASTGSRGTSDPNNAESYTYDANGNRVSLTKRDGQRISYVYDALNRKIQTLYPSASASLDVAASYDPAGRICWEAYSANAPAFGSAAGPCNVAAPSGTSVAYGYDSAGRLTSEATAGLAMKFGLDKAGNRVSVTWPDNVFYAGYVYDAMNRVTAVNENGVTSGAGLLATYAYDTLGRRTTITRGNGTTTSFGYDLADRMSSLAQSIPADTAHNQTLGFAYSPASQVVTRTWTNQAYSWLNHPTSGTNSTYDGLNRDASIATTAPTNCPTTTLPANAGYDCNGNELLDKSGQRQFAYDIENRLTSANETATSVSATLAYDPLGRLETYTVTLSGTPTPTTFLYEGSKLVAEYQGGALTARYVHGPGIDEPLVWYQGSGTANRNWLHMDRQGSVIATSNTAGVVTQALAYGPFGEPQAWGGSRFAYTGQIQLPEVQLYHYKARAYDPVTGRFLQTDPVGYAADNDLYAYVGNDPLGMADPSGLQGCTTGTRTGGDSFMCEHADGYQYLDQPVKQSHGETGGGGEVNPSSVIRASARQDFDDRVEFQLHAADQAAIEAAYARSRQGGNYLVGITGEQYMVNWLAEHGVQILATNVGVRDQAGELRIYDAIGRNGGVLQAYEFKANGGVRTSRQVRIDESIGTRGGSVANPVRALAIGLVGSTRMQVVVINARLRGGY